MADSTPADLTPTPPAGPRSEAEILADARLHERLASYHPLHHESFLKSYARVLSDLHDYGERHEQKLEYLLRQHDSAAYKYLWMIQHQKLFDLECQWRAELVEVPGARLTADFEDWHDNIEACQVIPGITPDELALLEAFVGQLEIPDELEPGNPAENFWLQRRYPHMRPNLDDPDDDNEEPLTAWTEFWDLHRGTGYLRMLPDLRGDREFRYERAVRDEQRRARPAAAPSDPRPHVPTWGEEYDDIVRDLLRRYEPPTCLRRFEARKQLEAFDASEDRNDLPLALERLKNAGVQIPIEGHADWRQAIIRAADRHYLGQLQAALPHVYDHYSQRQALNIGHAQANESAYRHERSHFQWQEELIREGRRLLGEPDDIDF